MKKAYFNWSSGKDSALALYKTLQQKEYEIGTLLTNINQEYSRVSMHGLHENLLDAQAENIGLPLQKLYFPADVTMELYNQKMHEELTKFKQKGYDYSVFGDIFLEDLKAYRDTKLAEVNLQGVYPLWKQDTRALLKEFLALGFKAITVCVNAKLLGEEFVGRIIDEQFINDLPDTVDVCGENGEFHTFVFDGPIFSKPVEFEIGEKVLRSYTLHDDDSDNCHQSKEEQKNYDTSFWYCDLLPK
ncbi:Dph6-related ATP pyrophosphatase [Pseudotenacibaculum haliotis]|uniref:Diphthine--ammonia ligase n=1 Tax=Pseudotenacibaculum haliotis TaxID=1862138 RepID=A0ABW5LPQ1_9FLAO